MTFPAFLLLALLPQTETVTVSGTPFDFELARVPGGPSRLGSPESEKGRNSDEGPARNVELKPFWMARTEATGEAFVEYFERRERAPVDGITRPSGPYEPPNGTMSLGKHPAVCMRWHSALGFCAWLSEKTGQRFRLPTEAEWECAARAGSADAKPEALDGVAWTAENSGKKTHEGGKKKANAFGLFDMLGNVWEYCLEPYKPDEYNPVLRGGAWDTPAAEMRFARRQTILPEWYALDPNRPRSLWWLTDARFVGFRVVRMGDAARQEPQKAYRARLEVKDLQKGKAQKGFAPVTGEIVNGGDQTLWEVEVTLFWRSAAGKPIYEDEKQRATFTAAYPVLVNAYHPGDARAPLKPKESRRFSALLPEPFEIQETPEKVGAAVTGVRFAD